MILIVGILASSCDQIITDDKSWQSLIPSSTVALITPEESRLQTVLSGSTISLVDDLSQTSSGLIQEVSDFLPSSTALHAIAMLPTEKDRWHPIWIINTGDTNLKTLINRYSALMRQNEFLYKESLIFKLTIEGNLLFVSQLGKHTIISESSYAIERCVDTYLGLEPSLDLENLPTSSSRLLVNLSELDTFLGLESAVKYKPYYIDEIEGLSVLDLSVSADTSQEKRFLRFEGSARVLANPSITARSFSEGKSPIFLDRYISSEAAAFGLFRSEPVFDPTYADPEKNIDSVLLADQQVRQELIAQLEREFAFVAFEASGVTSIGEDLFLRRINDRSSLRGILETWVRQGLIEKRDNTYISDSRLLQKLLGFRWTEYPQYYIGLTGSVVIVSPRSGLTNRVRADRSRSRVIYYNRDYQDRKQNWPPELSSLLWVRSESFFQFVEPYLAPNQHADLLLSLFDEAVLYTSRDAGFPEFNFSVDLYRGDDRSNLPYYEQWIFPLSRGSLTGTILLEDVIGSRREELVFATNSGDVFVLATDGTVLLQLDTEGLVPLGQPVIYDWYANNQKAIMIAAGNKIFAWNSAGVPLPKFPIKLPENASSPLNVDDVNLDGIPEMIIATGDRNVYVLNGRGVPMNGWPLRVNSPVTTKPEISTVFNERSLWVVAQNALFAVDANGRTRSGFPKFLQAPASGALTFYRDHVLVPASDGRLYGYGSGLFTDSLDIFRAEAEDNQGGLKMQAVKIGDGGLKETILNQRLRIKLNDSTTVNERLLLVESSEGLIHILQESGNELFSLNLGQASSDEAAIVLADLNSDRSLELLGVSTFGRLYAWNMYTGERYTRIPNSGMAYPVVSDLDGDGKAELIALTRDGLRCWTINGD